MNIIKTNVPQDPLQAALMQNAQLNSQLQGANMLTHPDANNGWGGGLGILAAALGGYMQNKKGKELAANEYDINQQIAQFQAQKQQEMAAAEQAKAEAEYKRKMQEKEAERKFELEKQENKARLDNRNALDLARFKAENPTPGQTINIQGQGPAPTPMQETLGKKNAEKYNDWENQAFAANETMAGLQQLRQISQLQSTGRAQEAAGLISQWFGTEAGANMQAFNSVASGLVLQQAEKLKGAMSDGDIKLLESTMPQFGNDPRANEVIFSVLESAAQRSIKRFNDADAFFQEKGTLQGYKPDFQYSRTQEAQPQQQSNSQYQEGDTATNPQTGERLVYRNGQWVSQ